MAQNRRERLKRSRLTDKPQSTTGKIIMSSYSPDPHDGNDPFAGLRKIWDRVADFVSSKAGAMIDISQQATFHDQMRVLARRPYRDAETTFMRYGRSVCETIEAARQIDSVTYIHELRRQKTLLPHMIRQAVPVFETHGTQHHLVHGVATLVTALRPCEDVAIPVARRYIDLCPTFIRGHPEHEAVAMTYFGGVKDILDVHPPENNIHRIMTRELPVLRLIAHAFDAEREFDMNLGQAYQTMDPAIRRAAERPIRDGSTYKKEPI
jgi:hypothetical protein